MAAQKKHYKKYVIKEKEEILEETAANFKHGTETEVHVITTVVGLILPALLPPCILLKLAHILLILKTGNVC